MAKSLLRREWQPLDELIPPEVFEGSPRDIEHLTAQDLRALWCKDITRESDRYRRKVSDADHRRSRVPQPICTINDSPQITSLKDGFIRGSALHNLYDTFTVYEDPRTLRKLGKDGWELALRRPTSTGVFISKYFLCTVEGVESYALKVEYLARP